MDYIVWSKQGQKEIQYKNAYIIERVTSPFFKAHY